MNREPIVLGIESSCDETGIGIVAGNRLLTNTVSSSMAEHVRFGGVIPEIASRAHLEAMIPALDAALTEADVELGQVDALAVTGGPGLAGALMVGVAAAKALAAATGKPLYAINHLVAHVGVGLLEGQSGAVTGPDGRLPEDLGALLVSGGHTEILRVHDIAGDVRLLGATLDDAAGEAYDKVARILGLPYPGGPAIDRVAREGDPRAFRFPRGLSAPKYLGSAEAPGPHRYDFSFSGLKTAAFRIAQTCETEQDKADLADAVRNAIARQLSERSDRAMADYVERHQHRLFVVAGGVAANKTIRATLQGTAAKHGFDFLAPPMAYCTDNAAMIALAGAERLALGLTSDIDVVARPRWPLDEARALSDPSHKPGRKGAKA